MEDCESYLRDGADDLGEIESYLVAVPDLGDNESIID
jgi:hypothetical protein